MNARIRLVCPNCAAQYEVDEDVIPVSGRDVQCSNCGQTWLAMRPSQAGQAAAKRDPDAQAGPVADTQEADRPGDTPAPDVAMDQEAERHEPEEAARDDAPAPTQPATPVADDPTAQPPETDWIEPPPSQDDYDEMYEDEADAPPPAVAEDESPERARRRALDAAVFDVLREEAEREASARRAEAGPIESQPDLGLTEAAFQSHPSGSQASSPQEPPPQDPLRDPGPPESAAEERTAFVRGLEPAEAAAEEAAAALAARPRHETLPNIEEINSTLEGPAQTGQSVPAIAAEQDVARGGGFRRGFVLMLVLAAAVVALYAYAPRLSEAAPSLGPALASFTSTVDAGRLWLDGAAQQATEAIRGISQNASE